MQIRINKPGQRFLASVDLPSYNFHGPRVLAHCQRNFVPSFFFLLFSARSAINASVEVRY